MTELFAVHSPPSDLARTKREDAGVAPVLGGHARGAAGAADLHLDREEMVDQHRLFPGLGQAALAGGFDHLAADRHDGAHQRERAGGRAALHAADRRAARADGREIQQQRMAARAGEGHALDHLDRLGLSLRGCPRR